MVWGPHWRSSIIRNPPNASPRAGGSTLIRETGGCPRHCWSHQTAAARQLSSELERMSGASHVCFFYVRSTLLTTVLRLRHIDHDSQYIDSLTRWCWRGPGTAISLSGMILSWSILRVSRCERDVYFSEPWMSVFFFKDLNSLTSRHCICRQQGI